MQQIPGRLPDSASGLDERSLESSPELSSKQIRETSLCSSDSHLSPRSNALPTSSSPDHASDSGDRDSSFLVVTTPSSLGESSPERTPPVRPRSPRDGAAASVTMVQSEEDEHRSIEDESGVLLHSALERLNGRLAHQNPVNYWVCLVAISRPHLLNQMLLSCGLQQTTKSKLHYNRSISNTLLIF